MDSASPAIDGVVGSPSNASLAGGETFGATAFTFTLEAFTLAGKLLTPVRRTDAARVAR